MNPVAVFRHSVSDGPGHFATFLDSHRIPWQLIPLDAGAPVPDDPRAFSGLGFMGGPMSVNGGLPWITQMLALIRHAVGIDVPVIGHCLGGQLLSKALGGVVSENPVKEIGWGRVDVIPGDEARRWLGDIAAFESFHWHNETFSIPPGATRLAFSKHCANQLFSLNKNIGMQCHVEIMPEMIAAWCAEWTGENRETPPLTLHSPSVQTPTAMLENVEGKVAALHRISERIYTQWIAGLAR